MDGSCLVLSALRLEVGVNVGLLLTLVVWRGKGILGLWCGFRFWFDVWGGRGSRSIGKKFLEEDRCSPSTFTVCRLGIN